MKEKIVNHMETHVPGGVVFSTLNGCGDRPPYNALTAIEDAKGMLCQHFSFTIKAHSSNIERKLMTN